MDLKTFLSDTLVSIVGGVSDANEKIGKQQFVIYNVERNVIEFDVAVTVESTDTGKGGGEIKVWGIGQIGANGSTELKNSTISRVSFGVDIAEYTKAEKAEQNNFNQSKPRSNPAR